MLERFNIVKDNLKELVLHLNKISEIEYNTINIVIENIISNNINNLSLIENTFDRLLSLVTIEEDRIKYSYDKLLNYSKKIDIELYNDYKKIYKEFFSEETVKVLKY